MRHYLPVLIAAIIPSAAFAQRDAKVPDPDPEIERKTFIVAPGFEVNLFAADPLLAKPIQMNFDPQGRLWVASSEVYPQIKPGEKANDKIIVLEDSDNDGKADKTTVFADGLLIPTGVEPGDGGAYVANSTELVHLSASKPGGKADRKRILLSGFGTEDTHHIIHTFRWGPDCRLYFTQSIYIHSHVETPHGVKRLNAGGIWRFNPDRTELDIFCRGWVNSWGHAFDRYGQSLVTDGAGGEGINHAIPGAYYLTSQGPHAQRVLHGMNPGSPKYCGLEIVSGRHFPDDWQGDCITNDFRGHRVCRFKLADDGSTFAAREMTEVIKSTHPAFRPIDVKMGPDGALYIADWYNPIIQHGEVDFRDPRRDKTHGRIWRVSAKGRPLVPKPKLVDATIPELLENLKAPEQWTRQQAKRVLKERGAEKVLPELNTWLSRIDKDNPANDALNLEAVWVAQSFSEYSRPCIKKDDPAGDALLRSVTAQTAGVKAMGIRVMGECVQANPVYQSLLNGLIDAACRSDEPRVRIEAVRATVGLKDWGSTIAIKALDKPLDRTLDYALWLTIRELEPYWLPEFKAGNIKFGGDAKKVAFALAAVGSKDTMKALLTLASDDKLPVEQRKGLWLLIATIGGPAELEEAFQSGHFGQDNADTEVFLKAVETNIRERKVGRPPNKSWDYLYDYALAFKRPAIRQAALRIMGLWKIEKFRTLLEQLTVSEQKDPGDRKAALEGLVSLGGQESLKHIQGMTDIKQSALTRRFAIIALAGIDIPTAAAKAAELLAAAKTEPELLDLYAAFIARKAGVPALAKALAGKKLNPEVAKLGLQAVRASTLAAPELTDALTKAGDLAAARKPPTPDEVNAMVADAAKADAARGEIIYRRKELQCLACHAYGGAGGQVGPDMTSIGASAQPDYLVESLLIPHKAVKEGYHALRVVTLDDRVQLGVKVREADGLLVLRTPEDKEVTIPVKDIAERGEAKSIMPEGLTDTLTKQEFADLVAFLAALGKVGGPYAPSKARVVRRWQVIDPTNANLNAFRRGRVSAAAEPNNSFAWSSAYSLVSGDLSLAELPKFTVWNDTAAQTVLRFQLDVTTAGAAKLKFNSVAGLSIYLGSTPIEAKAETALDLKNGLQTVTLLIDRTRRTEDVRVELEDMAGSPARVTVVGGK